jgi:hypothetical protein
LQSGSAPARLTVINNMTIYLVYGLDRDDCCEEPYVKKAFACEKEAKEYRNSKVKSFFDCKWYVTQMELDRPPNLD